MGKGKVVGVVFYNGVIQKVHFCTYPLKDVLESRSVFLNIDGGEYLIKYYSDLDSVAFATLKE